jgi:hypothetical protein
MDVVQRPCSRTFMSWHEVSWMCVTGRRGKTETDKLFRSSIQQDFAAQHSATLEALCLLSQIDHSLLEVHPLLFVYHESSL